MKKMEFKFLIGSTLNLKIFYLMFSLTQVLQDPNLIIVLSEWERKREGGRVYHFIIKLNHTELSSKVSMYESTAPTM